MQDQNKPDAGILSRLPKPSLRQRRLAAMGTAAVTSLVAQITGETVSRSEILFHPELVVRESTGAAPSGD